MTNILGTIDFNNFLIILISVILGIIISFTYKSTGKYTSNMLLSLTMLVPLVTIVLLVVNGSVGTSIAILGVFSLIRFRSLPGSSRDILFIFFSMAIGTILASNNLLAGIISTILISIIILILVKSSIFKMKEENMELKILIPENLSYNELFNDEFEKYTNYHELTKIKNANMGTMFELTYSIKLKNLNDTQLFINDMRCKNGNLSIIIKKEIDSLNEQL